MRALFQHHFHPTILRAYDIRGIIGETLNEADAHALGIGFAAMLRDQGGKRIALGRDGRLSSPMLETALAEGLVRGGMEVLRIGCGPTPMLYFASYRLKADAAIQVTGSHNPPNHNGFKMVVGQKPFFADAISRLGTDLAAGVSTASGGSNREVSIEAEYLAALLGENPDSVCDDQTCIIWDCGNGATGPLTEALTARLNGRHQVLFADIDGRFPNHHPDPVDPATLTLLRQAVAAESADLGIGFDGDGDRIGLIDARGRQVPGDLLTAFLARGSLRRHPGAEVIFDVKSSLAALATVSALGGRPQLWKTGHSHIKTRLRETGAPLAGEMSGHLFIADGYYGFDDALFAAMAVLREIAEGGQSITDFMDHLPPIHATPELRIPCADETKFSTIASVVADTRENPPADDCEIADMDGIRVTSDEGWWLIRASNTGAELVARAEGRDAAALEKLSHEIETRLQRAGLDWSMEN